MGSPLVTVTGLIAHSDCCIARFIACDRMWVSCYDFPLEFFSNCVCPFRRVAQIFHTLSAPRSDGVTHRKFDITFSVKMTELPCDEKNYDIQTNKDDDDDEMYNRCDTVHQCERRTDGRSSAEKKFHSKY